MHKSVVYLAEKNSERPHRFCPSYLPHSYLIYQKARPPPVFFIRKERLVALMKRELMFIKKSPVLGLFDCLSLENSGTDGRAASWTYSGGMGAQSLAEKRSTLCQITRGVGV